MQCSRMLKINVEADSGDGGVMNVFFDLGEPLVLNNSGVNLHFFRSV